MKEEATKHATTLNPKGGIGKSIAKAREEKGMNQSELARAVGVSPQAVQKWEAGTSTPRPSKVADLAAALGIDAAGLLAAMAVGAGPVGGLVAGIAARLGTTMRVHVADDNDMEVLRIPYYAARGSCGSGVIIWEAPPKGYLIKEPSFFRKYSITPEHIAGVYADGNSNANFIVDGDIALFDTRKKEPRSGKLFLIEHPDGLRIKQLRRLVDGSWILECLNPDKIQFPDETIHPSQAEHLRIVGEFFYRQGG
ncbi:XRE family transcriptional regulator [Ralstonia syzygii]|uniref:XRE family transcriptional regulator n=1 Tax=Ralstonia syzygii TaxID=28097 RepID=UPI0035128142